MRPVARVEDTTEDIWAELDDLNDKLDGSWTRWASSGWRTSSPGGLTTEPDPLPLQLRPLQRQ